MKIYLFLFVTVITACNNKNLIERFAEADALILKQKNEEALDLYNKLALKYDKCAEVYAKRGELLMNMNLYNTAMIDFDYAIYFDSTKSDYFVFRGRLNTFFGDTLKAIKDFHKAVQIDSNSYAFVNLAQIEKEFKRYDRAKLFYDISIRLNSTDALLYNNRASFKKEIGLYQEALEDINVAIKMHAIMHPYIFNRADIKRKLKDYNGALEDINKAMEMCPDVAYYFYLRGIIYKEMGDVAKCCEDYKQAVNLGYTDAQKDLDEICNKK